MWTAAEEIHAPRGLGEHLSHLLQQAEQLGSQPGRAPEKRLYFERARRRLSEDSRQIDALMAAHANFRIPERLQELLEPVEGKLWESSQRYGQAIEHLLAYFEEEDPLEAALCREQLERAAACLELADALNRQLSGLIEN